MKTKLLSVVLMLCFVLPRHTVAQSFTNIPLAITDGTPMVNALSRTGMGQQKNATCSVDTVLYTMAKTSSQQIKILVNDGTYASRYGQNFGLSQTISLQGMVWYGYSHDPAGATNPSISVDCSVYTIDANGFPVGTPLATSTITVDSNSANAKHVVIFSTPVSVSSNYALVLSHTQTDYLYVLSNDENTSDGAAEGLSTCYYDPGPGWYKNINLWGLGDFDLLMYPIVDYSLTTNFSVPPLSKGCVGISVDFTNSSSWIIGSKYYNTWVQGGGSANFHWDYGDGNATAYTLDGLNTYASAGTYNIELRDTIYGWTMTCTDLKIKTINVYNIPPAPSSTPPVPVCEGTPIGSLTATGTGGTIYWWSNPGITNNIGSGSPFNSGITSGATVYVTQRLNGCNSPSTSVVLTFLSNPTPYFNANYTGGTTFNFTGAPVASTYAWDMGDGTGTSTIQAPTYSYGSGGSYSVCLDVTYANTCTNQYCTTATIVGVDDYGKRYNINIYPNPANQGFNIDLENYTRVMRVELLDILGNTVYSGEVAGSNNYIPVENLSAGSYFIKIHDADKGIYTGKVQVINY